jgi:hypothetical protein
LAARINTEAWDALGEYAQSANMSIPAVHDALQKILGDDLQRDLSFWNSIIDQLYGDDSYARYSALREEHINIIDFVSTIMHS